MYNPIGKMVGEIFKYKKLYIKYNNVILIVDFETFGSIIKSWWVGLKLQYLNFLAIDFNRRVNLILVKLDLWWTRS